MSEPLQSLFRLTRIVFLAGKYSDELGRADEWFARGKMVSVPVNISAGKCVRTLLRFLPSCDMCSEKKELG